MVKVIFLPLTLGITMGEGQAVAVIPYSTNKNPVDLNDNVDVSFAMENKVREVAPTNLFF